MLLFAALPTPNGSGSLLGESPQPQTLELKNLHLQQGEKNAFFFFAPFPSFSPFLLVLV